MLVKAMEVSGIEGSYRSTCERTMTVLRESRDSLVAMLEAFVYDPLISWRLVGLSESKGEQKSSLTIEEIQDPAVAHDEPSLAIESGPPADLSTTVLHESIAEGFDEDGVEGEEVSCVGCRGYHCFSTSAGRYRSSSSFGVERNRNECLESAIASNVLQYAGDGSR